MENMVFRMFGMLFQLVQILIFLGIIGSALMDLQARAFHSKSVGLTSMLKVNQQLVGK